MALKIEKWIIIKIFLWVILVFIELMDENSVQSVTIPFYIFPIISILMFGFAIFFFKSIALNKKLSKGCLKGSPISLISNPLSFFQFVGIACSLVGITGVVEAIYRQISFNPVSFFYISIGIPMLLSVSIANRCFVKNNMESHGSS